MTDHPDGSDRTADIRLVESSDGWLLSVSSKGVAALLAGRKDASTSTEVSVEVHPNLVPGEPFRATVQVAELAPGRS